MTRLEEIEQRLGDKYYRGVSAPADLRYLLDTIRTLSADLERMEKVENTLGDKLTDALRENVRMRVAITEAYDDSPGWCDFARAILEGSKPE